VGFAFKIVLDNPVFKRCLFGREIKKFEYDLLERLKAGINYENM
jgi:hypothetical protein